MTSHSTRLHKSFIFDQFFESWVWNAAPVVKTTVLSSLPMDLIGILFSTHSVLQVLQINNLVLPCNRRSVRPIWTGLQTSSKEKLIHVDHALFTTTSSTEHRPKQVITYNVYRQKELNYEEHGLTAFSLIGLNDDDREETPTIATTTS